MDQTSWSVMTYNQFDALHKNLFQFVNSVWLTDYII